MSLRPFRSLLLSFLAGTGALAQSYQTAFSDVKFDRAKGPATFTAGLEVEAATGAASMNLPFGPGIGERGLKFRPILSMRMGPQMAVTSSDVNVIANYAFGDPLWGLQSVDSLFQRGFGAASFSPGTLDLGALVSTTNRKTTTYSLPGGGGGRVLGKLPAATTPSAVQALLSKFGFSATDTVGFLPGSTSRATKAPFLQMGSDGSLVVGLRLAGPAAGLTDEVSDDIQQNPASVLYQWDFPRRIAVIQGEVAYEFHYVHHTYMTRTLPFMAVTEKPQLSGGHYVITKIRNKFGESIEFVYDTNGVGYTASWRTSPAAAATARIRVEVLGQVPVAPGQPRLMLSSQQVTSATQIRVSYQGVSQPVSSYLLEVADPNLGTGLVLREGGGPAGVGANSAHGVIDWDWVLFDTPIQSIQPLRVTQERTNEEIRFAYGVGPECSWDNGSLMKAWPTVLASITFPTRTVSLTWEPYRFRMNYSPEGWGGFVPSTLPGRPAYGYGVVRIDDSDGTQLRTTRHQRVVPVSNWNNLPLQLVPPDRWMDTRFYDVITHADGSVSLHRFVEPPPGNALSGAGGMQNLAFIKALEREVRYYAPGVDWQTDLAVTNPSSSSAYRWVVKDRFDVRTAGAPDGNLSQRSVPYPTRVRSWDKESQLLTTEETTDWDGAAFGWKTAHTTTSITASPSFAIDYLSLAQQGTGFQAYPATKGIYRRTDKTYEAKPAEWILARIKSERSTTVEDQTGFLASDVSLPAAEPLVTKTFHADVNRVEAVELSNAGAPTISTAFSFQGTTGLAAMELQSAYLNGQGLVLSGQLGVSAYGYDANGYLTSISQKPNAGTALTVGQTSDELGRPIAQSDMNGTVKTYGWDAAGRLSGITSSDGDEPTTITYDDVDHRGIKVVHGLRVVEFRYNGFGQLILERRKGPDGLWSHRIYGYDLGGRSTGETVWLPGDGADHEALWIHPALTRAETVTTPTPGKNVCKKWGFDEAGNAVCIAWQTIPASSTQTIYGAQFAGAATRFDGRGRVILTQDGNGVETTTEYAGPGTLPPGVTAYVGPIRKVTVGSSQVKWLESDAAGRLVRLTTPVTRFGDPLRSTASAIQNLRTEYRYDGGDRIKEVKQFDEVGRTQTRTWGYNALGWLTSLGQPESGTTAYGGFTVAGKPTLTDYNGRQVAMTPDWMGRPLTITSAYGPVSQSFTYDSAIQGKGRIASSTDGSVSTTYSYAGQGKRLSSLATTVAIQGATQSFVQEFAYNTYGDRTAGTTGHAGWTQTFHAESGLPSGLKLGTTPVANLPWAFYDPVSWSVRSIAYGNGAASYFDYSPDQVRLKELKHLDGQMAVQAHWGYSYDTTGNLTREYDKTRPDGAGSWAFDQYGYDELNRLVAAVVQSPTYGEQLQQFDYDAFGNRTSSSLSRITGWSGSKDAANSVVTTTTSGLLSAPGSQVVNAAFTQGSAALLQNRLPATTATGVPTGAIYDSQGNLTQVFEKPTSVNPAVLTMTYDALGRVLSVSSTRTGLTEMYQYTVEGLRTVVQEYRGGALQKTRVNLYNDARQLVSQYEKTATGPLTWKRDILYLGTREAAEFDATGMHVTQVDHLGSPRVITGPTGLKEGQQKYLPFGELLEQSGPFKSAKGYTNHEQTEASGLIYMQARFYLPWFGRFASPDPARDQHFDNTQSWNIYSYVRNSPMMSTDPTGMVSDDNDKASPSKTRSIAESKDSTAPGPGIAAQTTRIAYFQQSTGEAWIETTTAKSDRSSTDTITDLGDKNYSGRGEGKNNPDSEDEKGNPTTPNPNAGVIPAGEYRISGPEKHPSIKGDPVLRLTPTGGQDMHGRNGFLIHGDSSSHPGEASQGCIVMPRAARQTLVNMNVTILMVIGPIRVSSERTVPSGPDPAGQMTLERLADLVSGG